MVLFRLVGARALLTTITVSCLIVMPYEQAFAFMPTTHQRPMSSTTNTHVVCQESDEELIHDIEVMNDEAKHRLQNLLEQMDELQAFQHTTTSTATVGGVSSSPATIEKQASTTGMIEEMKSATRTDPKGKTTHHTSPHIQQSSSALAPEKTEEEDDPQRSVSSPRNKEGTGGRTNISEPQQSPRKHVDVVRARPLDLLGDTSWKIVLNIGREHGTWMPPRWGKSGGRLRVEVHCTFSREQVVAGKDPFFAHSVEPMRVIEIEEAFVWPTDVGVGRRSLQIDPKAGRYQICPGVGPAGTDLLRLMIPIPVDLSKDDVTLNAGRVYGTTGYFGHPDAGRQEIITTVQEEYDHCLTECAKLQRELKDADNIVSWCRARHAVWTAERALDQAVERVTLAGQHYPDHAHMRTDPTGRVGLAKEGGLCVQVHTGLAMEYHILGRMDVGHLKR